MQTIPYWRFSYKINGATRRTWVSAPNEYAAHQQVLYREPLASHITLIDIIG